MNASAAETAVDHRSSAPPAIAPVSVAICTRNRPALLQDVIRSVLAGDLLPAEMLIVDQSDRVDDAFAQLSAAPGITLRHEHLTSRGLSRARNAAVELARCAVVAFTDDDVIVDRGWLAGLWRCVETEDSATVVTGSVRPLPDEKNHGFVPTLKQVSRRVTYTGLCRIDPLVTFNMAIHRSTFKEVGGLDVRLGPGTHFPAGEDNEFCHCLLDAGCRVICVPEAVVYHRAWRRRDQYVPLRWAYGRGQGAFFATHLETRNPFMWRRLGGSVARLTLGAAGHLVGRQQSSGRPLPRTTLALGDLTMAAGILWGAVGWWRRHGGDRMGSVGSRPSQTGVSA